MSGDGLAGAGGSAGESRRSRILRLIASGVVRTEDLADRLGVSLSTVRRDLSRLRDRSGVVRTYGGALIPQGELSLVERGAIASREKEAIARSAAELVPTSGLAILDAGTTVGALAVALRAAAGLTVVTNSLSTARVLEGAAGVEIVMLGGSLRRVSGSTVGPAAERALAGMTADVAMLSADGVDAVRGLSEATESQASLKSAMMASSSRIVVLADAGKLGARGTHWWSRIDGPWTLVTDDGADEGELDGFRARGVDVRVAAVARDEDG